jgi:nicotinate-nucleotide--dimethylbenzimidazole phosphoribosyltransferase
MATSPTTPPRPTPIAASSIETLLLREKLVTPDQIAHAMTVQVATGKTIEEVVRENGWVSEADLARLLQHVNPHAEPTPAVVEAPDAPKVVELPVVAPFPTVVPEPVQQVTAPEPVHPVVAVEPEPAPATQVVVPQPEPVVPQIVVPEPVQQVVEPEPVQEIVEPEPAPQVVVPQPVHTVPVPEPVQPVAAPEPVQPEPVQEPAAVQPVAAPAPSSNVVSAAQPVDPEEPVASPALQVHVMLRLTNGERIQMASFEEKDVAKQFALEFSRELALSADWPFLGGRFIRPEAVVSIDIDLTAF